MQIRHCHHESDWACFIAEVLVDCCTRYASCDAVRQESCVTLLYSCMPDRHAQIHAGRAPINYVVARNRGISVWIDDVAQVEREVAIV